MKGLLQAVYGAKAQVGLGLALTLAGIVGWPLTALMIFRREPQGILALSWIAVILAGYNLVATGLGYRATERVEAHVVEKLDVEAEQVEVDIG